MDTSDPDPVQQRQFRVRTLTLLWGAVLSELTAVAVSVYVWLNVLNASVPPLIVGVTTMIVVAAALYWFIWHVLRSSVPLSFEANRVIASLTLGGLLIALGLGVIALRALENVSAYGMTAMALALWFLVSLRVVYRIAEHRVDRAGLPPEAASPPLRFWYTAGVGLLLTPWITGWLAASVAIHGDRRDDLTPRVWLDAHKTAAPKECRDWDFNNRPIIVAVALSGGGYRAAVTHAGVLAALDDQCVPTSILSTVSGGSIVGASYVLGIPPRQFAERLARRKPGFTEARLNVANVWTRNSDLYRRHLREVYFGERTFQHLPDVPILLLNVTSLGSPTYVARAVLVKDRTFLGLGDELPIADAVAASSAFPGPFQPIRLAAKTNDIEGSWFVNRGFTDGGVVENLGVEGLRSYLTDRSEVDTFNLPPDLLIVSDTSGYGGQAERMLISQPADELLLRSSAVQFDTLHRMIYNELTGTDHLPLQVATRPVWQQSYAVAFPRRFVARGSPGPGELYPPDPAPGEQQVVVIPEKLRTVVIPTTLEATDIVLKVYSKCVGPSGESAVEARGAVSAFDTLTELNESQVRQAFWVGYTMGRIYGAAIECARSDIAGAACTQPPPTPRVDCPDPQALLP